MPRPALAAACLLAPLVAASLPAGAQETGFATMHASRRVGGLLCFTTHEHAGQSLPSGSRSVAVKLAINNWERFTAEEYGKSWGRWTLATGKSEKCTGAPGNIVCEVTAKPCKPLRQR